VSCRTHAAFALHWDRNHSGSYLVRSELSNDFERFDILRSVILQELSRSDDVLRGEIEADESYLKERKNEKEAEELVARILYLEFYSEVEKEQSILSRMFLRELNQ
jgi:hypothetical protein